MWTKICNFFRRLTGTKKCKDIGELVAYIKPGDLYGLGHWILQLTPYTDDKLPTDEWKNVDQTIADGGGDCEDRAVVCYHVIRYWPGWTPYIICVFPMDVMQVGHAVCGFQRPDGSKGYLDGGGVYIFDKEYTWPMIVNKIRPWVYRAYFANTTGENISDINL